jgi:hypothetical protein
MTPRMCPNCEHPLTEAELKSGWCESCGKKLPGWLTLGPPDRLEPALEQPTTAPALPSRVVRKGSSEELLQWGAVRSGLGQMILGLILVLAGEVAAALQADVTASALRSSQLSGPTMAKQIFTVFTVGAVFVGCVIFGAGTAACASAPADSGTKGLAVCSTVFLVLAVLFLVVYSAAATENQLAEVRAQFQDLNNFGRSPKTELPFRELTITVMQLFLLGLHGLQAVFLLLFLRAVAAFFRNWGLAMGTVVYLVFYLLVVSLGTLAVFALRSKMLSDPQEYFPMIARAVGAAMAVWFVVVVGLVRGLITRSLLR